MALVLGASGTVETSDIHEINVRREPDGTLLGTVIFKVTCPEGDVLLRRANWVLSAGDKTAIAGLLPAAKNAVKTALGI